jgi:lipid-A-disaccharide synthase
MRIALVAGEASGDVLGAGLVSALRVHYPDAEFIGVGGPLMRAVGVNTWWDCGELAVMGLLEVLRHLPRLLRLRRELAQRLLMKKPDVFIGIDAPDFNLALERKLKRAGIPTVHYVSPSVWAWREKRAARMAESADRVLCLFPMEPPIYARHGVDARFVGHPLADHYPLHADPSQARSALGIDSAARVLALLPGSRLGEIKRLGPIFIATAACLQAEDPALQIWVPMANAACRALFEQQLQEAKTCARFHRVDQQSDLVMQAADRILLASGTAALEALLCKRPMVVAYRINALTYWLVTRLKMMRVNRFSLPNALANEALVSECMQADCTPPRLYLAVAALQASPERMDYVQSRYLAIHQQLRQDASIRAAEEVVDLLRPSQHAT